MSFRVRLAALLAAAPLVACGGGDPAPAQPQGAGRLRQPPPIVLVSIDTLRRDHLGCYGYFRDTTPVLDGLAQEGVLYERALASMASTFPSHLTMLTGLYPFQHGLTSNRAAARQPFRSVPGCGSVVRELVALGWETAAFTSSVVLNPRTGIDDGFQTYEAPAFGMPPFPAGQTTARALEWLDARSTGEPFFLFVHYFDVHEPNEPPPPFDTLFRTDAELEAWIDRCGITGGVDVGASVAKRFFGADVTVGPEAEEEDGPAEGAETFHFDRAAVADLFNRYDGSLRYVDAQIGRLVQRLEEKGLWDEVIFVFVADHGQSLGERDLFGHGRIWDVNTFVPWIVHFPEGLVEQPQRFAPLVSLVDLLPTVLARFEEPRLDDFRAQLEGLDTLSGAFPSRAALTQEATEFRWKRNEPSYGFYADRWKLVLHTGQGRQLYDLDGKGEGFDVSASHPDVVRELEQRLATLLERVPSQRGQGPAPTEAETDRLLKDLEALGYAGD